MIDRYVFIGDIHGNEKTVKDAIEKYWTPQTKIIQVGDFGIGFKEFDFYETWSHVESESDTAYNQDWWKKFDFIRGNHDNPQICKYLRNCHHSVDIDEDVLYISGAASTDVHLRTEGVDWWPDEEIALWKLNLYLEALETAKYCPKIIVSHEAPLEYLHKYLSPYHKKSRTNQFLDALIDLTLTFKEKHQPKIWVHGHHHRSTINEYKGIKFISLGIDEVYVLEAKDI